MSDYSKDLVSSTSWIEYLESVIRQRNNRIEELEKELAKEKEKNKTLYVPV